MSNFLLLVFQQFFFNFWKFYIFFQKVFFDVAIRVVILGRQYFIFKWLELVHEIPFHCHYFTLTFVIELFIERKRRERFSNWSCRQWSFYWWWNRFIDGIVNADIAWFPGMLDILICEGLDSGVFNAAAILIGLFNFLLKHLAEIFFKASKIGSLPKSFALLVSSKV